MLLSDAAAVVAMEREYANMSDSALKTTLTQMRELFVRGREGRIDRLRAFAILREAAVRVMGERPYLVQIAGAMAVNNGYVAEMATGEGKTLTAVIPAILAAWRGRGCHVITVNDYLASRDAQWMRPLYEFCHVSVAHIEQDMPPAERRIAYHADVTYCTNKEVAADFLRDRITLGRRRGLAHTIIDSIARGQHDDTEARLLQRGLHCAIVDEADSVLIDEAVTPLIISGNAPNAQQVEAYVQAASIAEKLIAGRHFTIDERYRDINLSTDGKKLIDQQARDLGGLWAGARRREELVTQALTARNFYLPNKHYVIQDGKVVIVDEFTGRLMPDREWREGLHQAVEAKEKLDVNPAKDTFARISFQRFFRLYRHLSGMTGTAWEACSEFWQIYRLPVVVIPTNRPVVRNQLGDMVFATENRKWHAIVSEIARVHREGRPVLIGTRSVGASEILSEMLRERGLEHQVLNAVRHEQEAQIVAHAGGEGCITVATNMAGRGTDIKLARGVADNGGMHVIASERHESQRIDRQLFGRCGRQGEPGSAQAIVSLEDELPGRYAPHLTSILSRRFANRTDEIVSGSCRKLFRIAQSRAQSLALRQRKGVLRTDEWLDESLGFAGVE